MKAATAPTNIVAAVTHIRAARARGDGFAAFDLALKAVRRHPDSLALAYHATMLAARLGALGVAKSLYGEFDLSHRLASAEGDPLVSKEDLLALSARLDKDMALAKQGADRARCLAEAAESYLAVASVTGGYYPLINAADLFALAGHSEQATQCARQTLETIAKLPASVDEADASWRLLSIVEAHHVLGNVALAAQAAREASATFHGDYSDLATTIRQLDRLVAAQRLDFVAGQELGMPSVLCYAGHRISLASDAGSFPASQEAEIAAAVGRFLDSRAIGWAYGSLAAGADILVVEALLERDIPTHIVLPFTEAEFVEASVRPSGPAWVKRFACCRRKVATCRTILEGSHFGDDELFAACTDYLLGLGKLQATQLGAQLTQLLIWDGKTRPGAIAGTAIDYERGRRLGATSVVIPTSPQGGGSALRTHPSTPSRARQARAMVFADVVGFSRIPDDDLPRFHREIMVPMAASIRTISPCPEVIETWGDAVFLVYHDVETAAAAALAMIVALDLATNSSLPLYTDLALRVSAHYGSTYDIANPFTGRPGRLGIHVSRAARIEPVTPPGVVYVSEAFAVQLALRPASSYRGEFVGTTRLAKKFGDLPVFRLVATKTPSC
jgi:class 3 adenylate cyclase